MSRTAMISELILQETRQLKMPGAARAFEALGRSGRSRTIAPTYIIASVTPILDHAILRDVTQGKSRRST